MPILAGMLIVIVWCGTVILIARLGGWIALAQRYRALEPFDGPRWRFQDGQFRWCNYGKGLTIGINKTGIGIWLTMPLFPGHPPLFIPWAETKTALKHSWWHGGDYLEITFPEVPNTVVRLRKKVADRIATAFANSVPMKTNTERL